MTKLVEDCKFKAKTIRVVGDFTPRFPLREIQKKHPQRAIISFVMISPEIESPFTPGRLADPRLFVGREAQIQQLLDAAKKARRGNFQIAYVSGERGIGKSSLVQIALHLAETQHNAVVAHAHLGGISDFAGLGRRAMEATVQDGETRPWGAKLLDLLSDRVSA